MTERSDIEVLEAYGIDDVTPAFQHRKVWVYRCRQPRGSTPDRRDKWTYYAVIQGKEDLVLKGLSQTSIRTQIGRVKNGYTATDCEICEYWRKATPISDGGCIYTIVPELTGFAGCPRFDKRNW